MSQQPAWEPDAFGENTHISPRRQAFDRWFLGRIVATSHWVIRHWLLAVNLANAVILVGAVAVPLMQMAGWGWLAAPIFSAFGLICEQRPERSYFLGGYQMAMDQRMTAIYTSSLLAGLAFAALRDRLRPLSWQAFLLLSLPISVDGFTQLFGWRISDWQLRTATGALFGLATVWLAYPRLEGGFAPLREAADAQSRDVARADSGSETEAI